MKDKLFLFPALILVLTPCVWYSNQPGVDGIQGSDLLDWKSAVHSDDDVVCISARTDF